MKNLNFEVKSLLAIYGIIPQVADSIDRLVRTRACSPQSENLTDGVYRQTESILKLMEQKVNLINLKVLADETLCELPERHSKLIIARCIDKIDINFIAKSIDRSVRETFRRLKVAMSEFKRVFLQKIEANRRAWEGIVQNFFWIDVLNKIESFESTGNTVSFCPELVCSMILKRLRRIV